jgi:hypothetical protein
MDKGLSLFEKQLLGILDKTPAFAAEYEAIFGEPYTFTNA